MLPNLLAERSETKRRPKFEKLSRRLRRFGKAIFDVRLKQPHGQSSLATRWPFFKAGQFC